MNEHRLKVEFKKDYYQNTKIDNSGNVVVLPKLKTMYHFSLSKDYFLDDKHEILKLAIQDLKLELEILEKIDKQNDKSMDSWESVSK